MSKDNFGWGNLKWRDGGFYKIRSAPKVINELERYGQRITTKANKTLTENRLGNRIRSGRLSRVGYKMSSFQGKRKPYGRWFVQVYASSNHAKYSNAKHNTLIRLLNDEGAPAVDLRPGEHP